MADLWQRLRQRKLVQWAVAYVAAAFALLQGVDIIAQQFGWAESVQRGITLALVLGFFVALVLAWYHGERGAQKVSGIELLVLTLLLAIGGGMMWKYVGEAPAQNGTPSASQDVAPSANSPITVDDKSIAVLPFNVLSSGSDDALIADGLSEEIINSLSRVPDLRVAARSSCFALRGSGLSAPDMAARLNVANLLEGSIRRAGDRLRITTQLIRAADGYNIWSEDYDRDNDDIIAIQEDVARSIAQALKTVTDPDALADMQRIGTRSVPAYDAFLKGLALRGKGPETGDYEYNIKALSAFDQAIALDPDFEHANRAAIDLLGGTLDLVAFNAQSTLLLPHATRLQVFRERLDAATAHCKDEALANYYRSLRATVDLRYADALRFTQDYLAAHPEDANALDKALKLARIVGNNALVREYAEREFAIDGSSEIVGNSMTFIMRLGDLPRAEAMAKEAIGRFPGSADVAYQAQRILLTAGKPQDAARLVPALLTSDLDDPNKDLVRLRQACAEGRRADAEAIFASWDPDMPDMSNIWHGLLLLGREDEAVRMLSVYDQPDRLFLLGSFLIYNKFDASRFPNLRAVLEAQGIRIRAPQKEPYACPAAASAS